MTTITEVTMTDAHGYGTTWVRDPDDPYKWRLKGADGGTMPSASVLWQFARCLAEDYIGARS